MKLNCHFTIRLHAEGFITSDPASGGVFCSNLEFQQLRKNQPHGSREEKVIGYGVIKKKYLLLLLEQQ